MLLMKLWCNGNKGVGTFRKKPARSLRRFVGKAGEKIHSKTLQEKKYFSIFTL